MMEKEHMKQQEKLHALADGELDPNEREELLARLDRDPLLTAELCDIRRVKDLLDYAYPLPESSAGQGRHEGRRVLARAAGVVVLTLAAFAGGWWASSSPDVLGQGFRLADVQSDPQRVLLYLGESDPAKFHAVLRKARKLLDGYRRQGVEVYVVTSAGGVDLLRAATSPVAGEIRSLKERYASLHFIACNNTLFNLKRKGQPVKLVQGAEVAPSAVGFVVEHLRKGWTYVAI
jgi:intracellular sulfur oxidation DsrE/DsrF family protein